MGCCGGHHIRATDKSSQQTYAQMIWFLTPFDSFTFYARVMQPAKRNYFVSVGHRMGQLLSIIKHTDRPLKHYGQCNIVMSLLKLMIHAYYVNLDIHWRAGLSGCTFRVSFGLQSTKLFCFVPICPTSHLTYYLPSTGTRQQTNQGCKLPSWFAS